VKTSDIENDKKYYVIYKNWVYYQMDWGTELKDIFLGEKLIEMLDINNKNFIVLNFWEV